MERQLAQIVILGTGPVGMAIMEECLERGYATITLVNRRGVSNEELPPKVKIVAADITDAAQVAALCQSATLVFHAAQPSYTAWPEKFPPITTGVIGGIAQTQARLIVVDNLYMYGPTQGAPLTEDLSYRATGSKGRTRAQMADAYLAAHAAGDIQVVLARASDFFGPRVTASALGEIYFEPALEGKTVNVIGNPELPHTYTYIRDFARALVTLGESPQAYGQAWHVPSAPTLSTKAFTALVEQEIGRPIKLRSAGKGILTVLGWFKAEVREMVEMLYEFEEPFVVDHSRFKAAFGNGATPHAQAIAETVAWYQQRSEVIGIV